MTKVPGSIPRFYLKSLFGPPCYWVPEARVAERPESDRQPAIQHFTLYAFAAGERQDLWRSGFSLPCVKSVSFVEKVGTRAKNRWGRGRGEKESSSPLLLLPVFCSHYYFRAITRMKTLATQWFLRGTAWLRRTLRVGGKDVFFSVVCSHCWRKWTRCQSKYCARSRRSKPNFLVTRAM